MTKNRLSILLISGLFFLSGLTFAQVKTNTDELLKISKEKSTEYQIKREEAEKFAKENNIPIAFENDKGIFFELQYIKDGIPMYYKTDNSNAAKTISTNKVYPGGGSGLSLDGTGMMPREWDGGGVRLSHQEYGGRVIQGDNPSGTHWHATHVAGTIMAAGVQSQAKGMAYNANLKAFDWNSDNGEMAAEAADGALVSNHSYGFARGWTWTGSGYTWYGNPSISTQEDYLFGFYENEARGWDLIAANAPYYLIVKSAGNDRNEGPSGGQYPKDGPYDCIAHGGIAKNILTVGAVNDIPGGYNGPSSVSMSSFSSWGPADDGRIKPDIVANGVGLYSTSDSHNASYTSSDGTSMSAPSATGSLVLLQEHWEELNGTGEFMLAATLKGLVIHTADEAGIQDGPDYQFGWGLMNTKNAALRITEDQVINVIDEIVLEEGGSHEMILEVDGTEDLKVTICWTDVPGQPVSAQLDPSDPMLVNDLDLKITFEDNTYYPWKLNPNSPGSIATNNSENDVDNVEVVYIESPSAGEYHVLVDHDGSLSGGSQAFSIIVSGVTNTISLPSASAGDDMAVCENNSAQLNGSSTNSESSLWRSMGDGSFDDPTILNPIYTPGDADIEAGSVELELTVYAMPPLTDSIVDTVILTIVGEPMASAGDDFVVCGNNIAQLTGVAENYNSITWSTNGDGTFDDNSVLEPIYAPGQEDLNSGSVKLTLVAEAIAPCDNQAEDDVNLTFAISPVADAGEDETTCGNMPFQLSGSAIDNDGVNWTTTGDGTFIDPTLPNAVYIPGSNDLSSGTVDLILTALPIAPCETPENDTLKLTIEEMPYINAGEDETICGSELYQLTGVVDNATTIEWTTTGDGTFSNPSSLTTDYLPGNSDIENGEVGLILTAYFEVGCEMGFDEVVLSVVPQPLADAGADGTVCKDGVYTLSGSAQNFASTTWTTSGDGTFTNESDLLTDYIPGVNDGENTSVTITLSASPQAPCSEVVTSDLVLSVLNCDAIGENPENRIGFEIIPNPANNMISVVTDEMLANRVVIKIVGIDGRVVFSSQKELNNQILDATISTTELASGIYNVIITTENKAGVKRLVIRH